MATVYEDTPLRIDASKNIRLLEIHLVDDETAPLACNLRVVALQETPKYTALSYVWGPPTPAREILVNGQPFVVRENLWNFLHQAREDRRTCALWIDAICIDQTNNSERTHQVTMMGTIYSEAHLVLAWLGTATKHSAQWERAMKTVPVFRDGHHGNFKRWYKIYSYCVLDLYNSPYWGRMWIMQEYNLARQIVLQCGAHKATGESVSLLYKTWKDFLWIHGVKKRPRFVNPLAMSVIDDQVKEYAGSSLEMLVTWIGRASPRPECADQRDRVYALLSLCEPQVLADYSITPDYSVSILELYARFVRKIVNDERYGKVQKAVYIIRLPAALMLREPELEDLDHETLSILKGYRDYYDDIGNSWKLS